MVPRNSGRALSLALVIAALGHAGPPVFKVWLIQGEVTRETKRRSGYAAGPLEVFDSLKEGDRLQVSENAKLVIAFCENGRRLALKGKTAFTITASGVDPADKTEEVAAGSNVSLKASDYKEISDLSRPGIAVARAGAFDEPKISPAIGGCVSTLRPEFRWPAVAGAPKYLFVLSADGDPVWKDEPSTNTTRLPASMELTRGRRYHWSVSALIDGVPKPALEGEIRFTVAEERLAELIDRLKPIANSDDAVALSMALHVLWSEGALEEARPIGERLVKLQPETAVFHVILGDIHRRCGDTDKAEAMHRIAEKLGHRFARTGSAKKPDGP